MLRTLIIVAAMLCASGAARAENTKVQAEFVGEGTYSPTTGCQKLVDIENGKAEPNISTYPLTLTREGTRSWEGGCDFGAIREAKPGTFESKMQCSEGADEYQQTVRFTRVDADHIEVASGTDALVYERCKTLKGQ